MRLKKYEKYLQKCYFSYFVFKNEKIFIFIFFLFIFITIIIISYFQINNQKNVNSYQKTFIDNEDVILDMNQKNSNFFNLINEFIQRNEKNNLSSLGILEVFKYLITQNKFEEAESYLKNNFYIIKDPILKKILLVRLNRLQLNQKKFDEVIKNTKLLKKEPWMFFYNDILGEALFKKGEIDKTDKIWNEALFYNSSPILKKILQMKISNLN